MNIEKKFMKQIHYIILLTGMLISSGVALGQASTELSDLFFNEKAQTDTPGVKTSGDCVISVGFNVNRPGQIERVFIKFRNSHMDEDVHNLIIREGDKIKDVVGNTNYYTEIKVDKDAISKADHVFVYVQDKAGTYSNKLYKEIR